MNMKMTLMAAVVAFISAGYSPAGAADGIGYGRSQAPAPLEGAWRVSIAPYVCGTDPRQMINAPPVVSYLTFGPSGTLSETTSNPRFDPGQRGPGMGYWYRTGRTQYRAAFEAFILSNNAAYAKGRQRVEQDMVFDTDDDSWSSDARVAFYAGSSPTPVQTPACAFATAVRMY
jgi:hypothetical protein